ncbi:cadherin domain-containing protein [Limnoglobus roseus]|uniref:cadherin domain-containing protein n=1 Tax=Limnoglobus roseus TaxID=2598579 RepID=UPI00143DFCAD|nr:cadherin domain-containing protein [Limnoglobus roseus]
MGKLFELRTYLEALEDRCLPTVYLVTNTADSGTGSFRQAILSANTNPGTDTINFNIGTGIKTIAPITALPTITGPVTIDGTTQPGYAGTPLIELSGASAGTTSNGLMVTAGTSTVRGLSIDRFAHDGVLLTGTAAAGNAVVGSYLGLTPAGAAAANGFHGVSVESGAKNNVIGTNGDNNADLAERNVISGNAMNGVFIDGAGTTGNRVAGNYIGLNPAGTSAIGNGGDGVSVGDGASSNFVGTNGDGSANDAGEGNVISGNTGSGVRLFNPNTNANRVAANLIGLNATGTAGVGNGYDGVSIHAGASFNYVGTNGDGTSDKLERNVISGSKLFSGIAVFDAATAGNVIAGDYIGLNAAGTQAIANNQFGINLFASTHDNRIGTNGDTKSDQLERNVISGNVIHGVQLSDAGTTGNVVAGNYVGLNAAGTDAVPNGQTGVFVVQGANGNRIGTDGNGTADDDERNVISGNVGTGVQFYLTGASGNAVYGNYIGLNAAGTKSVANGSGVYLSGGAAQNAIGGAGAKRNVISGNAFNGVTLTDAGTTGNVVAGNYIGLNANGTDAVPNVSNNVRISDGAAGNTIGGSFLDGTGNVISGVDGDAIYISGTGTDNTTITGNYIGTDKTGTKAVPNVGDAVLVIGSAGTKVGGSVAGQGNVLSGNAAYGVQLGHSATNTKVQGNVIGLGTDGVALPNGFAGVVVSDAGTTGTIIGGVATTPGQGAGNVIGGNTGAGVYILSGASATTVQGNLIGLSTNGTAARPNGGAGVLISSGAHDNAVGGAANGAGNVIGGNTGDGVRITGAGTTANTIAGNFIGTDASGRTLGDGGNGVVVDTGATNNVLGGATTDTNTALGNAIANNLRGIYLNASAGSGNTIRFNRVTGNGGQNNVVNATNDPSPPNLSLVFAGSPTNVFGSLQGVANTSYKVDYYTVDAAGGASAYRETFTYTADAAGVVHIATTLSMPLAVGGSITAIATRVDTNGSSGLAAAATAVTASVNLSNSTVPENQPAGTIVGNLSIAGQNSGDPFLYNLTQATADNRAFKINGSQLSTAAVLNYEARPSYTITVQATDPAGSYSFLQRITITVTDLNDAPVITSDGGGDSANVSVNENETRVTTVHADDEDLGTVVAYSVIGGVDANFFSINPTTGVLSFVNAPDFENPADGDHDNVYEVVVQASDGQLTDAETILVSVADVNDNPPVIYDDGSGDDYVVVDVPENSTVVTTISATDADVNSVLTYSITGGADQDLFAINPVTGVVTFRTPPNFERPADADGDNNYQVLVTVSDGRFTDSEYVYANVYDVNEPPVIDTPSQFTPPENQAFVATIEATDEDDPTLTYAITGGEDAAQFQLDGTTGVLSFVSPPDHERPADANGDNIYHVTVQVSDGQNTTTQALTVTVIDENDNPPVIISNGGGTATVAVPENTTGVTTVVATDADSNPQLRYSITGGNDAARFTIDPIFGTLAFATAPDFESPTDANGDHVYEVFVQVSDGTYTDDQFLSVGVTNVVDVAPVITSNGGGPTATLSVPENTAAVTTITATDADAGHPAVTFSITGGSDASLFTLDPTTGVLQFRTPPDFEHPTDADHDNRYDVVVKAMAGSLSTTQALAVRVTDVNEPPRITSGNTFTLPENKTAVGTVTATDPDAGGEVLFAIVGGADAAQFAIDATTGLLAFRTAPDFEHPADANHDNVYEVSVQASDGSLRDSQNMTVIVTNVTGPTADFTLVNFIPPNGIVPPRTAFFNISFSKPVLGASSTSNYELRRAGADGLLGTADDIVVPVGPYSYPPSTGPTTSLAQIYLPTTPLSGDVYRLTVKDAITDAAGNALDGARTGDPGSDFVYDFVVTATAATNFKGTQPVPPSGFVGHPTYSIAVDLNNDGYDDVVSLVSSNLNTPSGYLISLCVSMNNFGDLAHVVIFDTGYYNSNNLAVGDFDGDGKIDLGVFDGNGILIFHGTGTGSFSGTTETPLPGLGYVYSLAVGDLNNDGLLDLAFTGFDSSNYSVINTWINAGQNHFVHELTHSVGDHFTRISLVDYNRDGKLDLIDFHPGLGSIEVLYGTGDGLIAGETTFNALQGYAYSTDGPLLSTDFNGDGIPDFVLSNAGYPYSQNNFVEFLIYRNALGTFSPTIVNLNDALIIYHVALGDFNGDGKSDVAVFYTSKTTSAYALTVLTGNGDGTFNVGQTVPLTDTFFSQITYQNTATALTTVNINRDGRLDLLLTDTYTNGYFDNDFYALISVQPSTPITSLQSPGGYIFSLVNSGAGAGQIAQVSTNAFNGLNRLQLNGISYAPVDLSSMTDSGQTLVTGKQNVAGVTVSRQITVPSTGGQDFTRTVDSYTNSLSSFPITLTVHVVGNLASDASTTVFAVAPDGSWYGTDDGKGGLATIHYIHGPSGIRPTSEDVIGDNIEWTYVLTILPGQTIKLATFTIVAADRDAAVAAANALVLPNGFGGQAGAFLSRADLGSLANFYYNRPPTDVTLSATSIPENRPAGTVVGTLAGVDPDANEAFTYALVAGDGSTDNGSFTIDGNQLKTAAAFDFEVKSNYAIRVRVTDAAGVSFTRVFTVSVVNLPGPTVTGIRGYYGNGRSIDLLTTTRKVLPWSITAIEVTFSAPVTAQAASLSLPYSITPVIISGVTGSGTNTIRWTFLNGLTTVNSPLILSAAGGNAIVSVSGQEPIAGNGVTDGTQYTRTLKVLQGDFDDNGVVNATDAALVYKVIGTAYNAFADVDGDGDVDMDDFNLVRNRIGRSL